MPPGTLQRNGVSERHNRTLLDIVQSMISLIGLPLSVRDIIDRTISNKVRL